MILFIFSGLSLTLVLCLYALKKNINLYYTPSQLMTESISTQTKNKDGWISEIQALLNEIKKLLRSILKLQI